MRIGGLGVVANLLDLGCRDFQWHEVKDTGSSLNDEPQ